MTENARPQGAGVVDVAVSRARSMLRRIGYQIPDAAYGVAPGDSPPITLEIAERAERQRLEHERAFITLEIAERAERQRLEHERALVLAARAMCSNQLGGPCSCTIMPAGGNACSDKLTVARAVVVAYQIARRSPQTDSSPHPPCQAKPGGLPLD